VSRVADGKVKLTVALDGARAQRRPRNRRWASAGGGGALGSRRQGERARQRAQMREGRWVSRARGLGRGRRTRGRGCVHGGEIVGERLETVVGARAGLNGPTWAELAFSIFLEFLLPFLFIFSRVFNSNSNQVSNSNQIEYVQQFKEYLGSI
jgi:hypothetical protein